MRKWGNKSGKKSGGKIWIKKRENNREKGKRKNQIKNDEKPNNMKSISAPIILWRPFWILPITSKSPNLKSLHDCTVYTSIFDQSWLAANLLHGQWTRPSPRLKAVTQETAHSFELYTLQAPLITLMSQYTSEADTVCSATYIEAINGTMCFV